MTCPLWTIMSIFPFKRWAGYPNFIDLLVMQLQFSPPKLNLCSSLFTACNIVGYVFLFVAAGAVYLIARAWMELRRMKGHHPDGWVNSLTVMIWQVKQKVSGTMHAVGLFGCTSICGTISKLPHCPLQTILHVMVYKVNCSNSWA